MSEPVCTIRTFLDCHPLVLLVCVGIFFAIIIVTICAVIEAEK